MDKHALLSEIQSKIKKVKLLMEIRRKISIVKQRIELKKLQILCVLKKMAQKLAKRILETFPPVNVPLDFQISFYQTFVKEMF